MIKVALKQSRGVLLAGATLLAVSTLAAPAHAVLTLTADGISLGFSLSTVVTGIPGGSIGPLGMAVNSDGNIIVDSSGTSQNVVFKDIDNQTFADQLSAVPNQGFPPAYANSGGVVYGSTGFSSGLGSYQLTKLNNDGSLNTLYPTIPVSNGLWTNPVNGHLLGAGYAGILDIDPVAGTYNVVTSTTSDGVTVSPDGTKVYLYDGSIYRISDGAFLGSFGAVSGADGMGIITAPGNPGLDGDIIVNTTSGNVVLVDEDTLVQTIIANGGSRGDYTTPDFTNGTLLLTQSDSIWRLSCGKDCGVGAPPPPTGEVPEPATLALLGAGLFGLGIVRRKRATV